MIVSHLSLTGAPYLELILPFLTSGPYLGARPDCWVSVEFLHALIAQKGVTITALVWRRRICSRWVWRLDANFRLHSSRTRISEWNVLLSPCILGPV